MYRLLKSILFLFPPEFAHKFALKLFEFGLAIPILSSILSSYYKPKKVLPTRIFGLEFKNPLGLAAGFDKNGEHINAMTALGFGFIEVGTVTPLAQEGNTQPRLFRLKKDQALINRMGFNNKGVDYLVERLKKLKKTDVIIGGNIGKNKLTPNEEAIKDYLISFRKLHPYVDYFVVNVSSPNTPNLRDLQDKEPLKALLKSVAEENKLFDKPRPILLKIAPDLSESQIDDVINILLELNIDGVIASNTTISRHGLQTSLINLEQIGKGGLSGKPLADRSTELIKYIHEKTQGQIPIIGVGGVDNIKSAKDKISAGASLIQLYTGFIYKGPSVVAEIVDQL